MKFLTPLGLIGLLGLAVLLLIYLLKPNYQQKMISSTFIWKLSLKYKKKNIPISKLRNFLILLCQILILSLAAFVLAQPALVHYAEQRGNEKIIVLDASASMRSSYDGVTRFERAKSQINESAKETFTQGGTVTLIYAGPTSETKISTKNQTEFENKLNSLECSYGSADIDGAMEIATDFLESNNQAAVYLYTGTRYGNAGNVTVCDVAVRGDKNTQGEWNAAILDVRTELFDGFYTIEVDVACYGRDSALLLRGEVKKANNTQNNLALPNASVDCRNDETFTIVYTTKATNYGENFVKITLGEDKKVFAYDSIYFYIEEQDSIATDNEYYVYGGTMPKIKIQYYSNKPNTFFRDSILAIRESWAKRHILDIELQVINKGTEPALEGFDVYIFEHEMPEKLPTDGVIFMMDPDTSVDAGFIVKKRVTIKDWKDDGESLSLKDSSHPIMQYIEPENIKVSEYVMIDEASLGDYDVLLNYQGSPVFFVKNTDKAKIAVMAFSINNSNLGVSMFFPVIMNNTLSYFFPKTMSASAYDVYDDVALTARNSSLEVRFENKSTTYTDKNVTIHADKPGTYTVSQELLSGKTLEENFYVRTDSAESNVNKLEAVLENPDYVPEPVEWYDDLLLYLAAALFAITFIEWWLHSREGI